MGSTEKNELFLWPSVVLQMSLVLFNDLEEITRIVHQYGARLLVDAAQLVAHRKVDMERCGIDYLAFSAHKVYAPFGCGVLVARKGLLNFSSPSGK